VSANLTEKTTILFADIGDSVRLYQKVGDAAGHKIVSESLQRMATAIARNRGVLLRTVGDASLARFDDPNAAVAAAIAIQVAHYDSPLEVRVGFHQGPAIEDRGDLYGNAVNIAARIADFARVNEITTTGGTVEKLDAEMQQRSTLLKESSVRGLDEQIAIYRVDWETSSDVATRIATRVVTGGEQASNLYSQELDLSFGSEVYTLGARRTALSIGRTDLADVCVITDRASREHALLEYRDGQFTLTDTSTNGTFIQKDGQPVYAVQRETVVLDGRGAIGIGVEPGPHRLLIA